MEPIHVLVWGTAKDGPCAYFRGYQYDEPLLELGVELKHISQLKLELKQGYCVSRHLDGEECPKEHVTAVDVWQRGLIEVDTSLLDWADVIMFRRYYNTTQKCVEPVGPIEGQTIGCGFYAQDTASSIIHEDTTGHRVMRQDDITRAIWPAILQRDDVGVVYETDDDHFAIKSWNGYYHDVIREQDLIRSMARRADILTTSTPVLARRYGVYNPTVRVVRNAIDPELYVRDTERPEGDKQRLVYYGSTARLRDYAGYYDKRGRWEGGYCAEAVRASKAHLRTIFLGTNEGTEAVVEQWFDEQHRYVEGIAAFSKLLTNSHADIGVAPLMGDNFDQAKSELHWLEYSMAGAATIGQRFNGGPDNGPYNVIREGIDGLLARGAQEWHDAVRKLARNPSLTQDLAAAAKERVLAEYDYRKRAPEWAEVFRFAAENRGLGLRNMKVNAA